MYNHDCTGHRVYARRVFANGTVHLCVQCQECGKVCRLEEHGYRPWLKANEIPPFVVIHPYKEVGQ